MPGLFLLSFLSAAFAHGVGDVSHTQHIRADSAQLTPQVGVTLSTRKTVHRRLISSTSLVKVPCHPDLAVPRAPEETEPTPGVLSQVPRSRQASDMRLFIPGADRQLSVGGESLVWHLDGMAWDRPAITVRAGL